MNGARTLLVKVLDRVAKPERAPALDERPLEQRPAAAFGALIARGNVRAAERPDSEQDLAGRVAAAPGFHAVGVLGGRRRRRGHRRPSEEHCAPTKRFKL